MLSFCSLYPWSCRIKEVSKMFLKISDILYREYTPQDVK
jgi:hypothetical protein